MSRSREATPKEVAAYERGEQKLWRCPGCGHEVELLGAVMAFCGECGEPGGEKLVYMRQVSPEPERPRMPEPHKLKLTIEDGEVYADLIHPKTGCRPATICSSCHRDIRDSEEPERCHDCPTGKETGCWLDGWDELAEYLKGQVCVTVDVTEGWDEAPELYLIENSEVLGVPEEPLRERHRLRDEFYERERRRTAT